MTDEREEPHPLEEELRRSDRQDLYEALSLITVGFWGSVFLSKNDYPLTHDHCLVLLKAYLVIVVFVTLLQCAIYKLLNRIYRTK